jgi:hypothetical protein
MGYHCQQILTIKIGGSDARSFKFVSRLEQLIYTDTSTTPFLTGTIGVQGD